MRSKEELRQKLFELRFQQALTKDLDELKRIKEEIIEVRKDLAKLLMEERLDDKYKGK